MLTLHSITVCLLSIYRLGFLSVFRYSSLSAQNTSNDLSIFYSLGNRDSYHMESAVVCKVNLISNAMSHKYHALTHTHTRTQTRTHIYFIQNDFFIYFFHFDFFVCLFCQYNFSNLKQSLYAIDTCAFPNKPNQSFFMQSFRLQRV